MCLCTYEIVLAHQCFVHFFLDLSGSNDDVGWWGLASLRAFDLTNDKKYLDRAELCFQHGVKAWDNKCGGGVWWSAKRKYKNSITNELFLTLAAKMHLHQPSGNSTYLEWAKREWAWFNQSGLVNEQGLVNDGLETSSCKNNGETAWTYNQGTMLSGLAILTKLTGDSAPLELAQRVTDATMRVLRYPDGVLRETCEPKDACNHDQRQFKGIFIRHLQYMLAEDVLPADKASEYQDFIAMNADSAWAKARNDKGIFGDHWNGPAPGAQPDHRYSNKEHGNTYLPAAGLQESKSLHAVDTASALDLMVAMIDGNV